MCGPQTLCGRCGGDVSCRTRQEVNPWCLIVGALVWPLNWMN